MVNLANWNVMGKEHIVRHDRRQENVTQASQMSARQRWAKTLALATVPGGNVSSFIPTNPPGDTDVPISPPTIRRL